MIQAIKRGEENFGGMGIKEEEIEKQTKNMLKQLEKENQEIEQELK